jgi:hypothetical protein
VYTYLGEATLTTGERLACGVVTAPDGEWAPRLEPFLAHKRPEWRYHNHIRQSLRRPLDRLETRFYAATLRTATGAVVGWVVLVPDELTLETSTLLDLYAHPAFVDDARRLMDAVPWLATGRPWPLLAGPRRSPPRPQTGRSRAHGPLTSDRPPDRSRMRDPASLPVPASLEFRHSVDGG